MTSPTHSAASASRRRTPLQSRSSDTVRAILDAASRLLPRLPFEQITTSRIAEEAGISVGALYRFFSDKQEIFDAIAVEELQRFRELAESSVTARRILFSPRKTIGGIIDSYIRFLDERPHFRVLALGRHISEETRQAQTDPGTGPGGLLQKLLGEKLGARAGRKLSLKIRVASEAGDRLIAFAYQQPTPEARDLVLAELRDMLQRYLTG